MDEAELQFVTIGDHVVACLDPDGPLIASEAQALDLIGALFGNEARYVVIPKQRLAKNFFDLKNGLLGGVAQKFVNYGLTLVFTGDFSTEAKKSVALRDFIRESNKRKQPIFVGSIEGLGALIAP